MKEVGWEHGSWVWPADEFVGAGQGMPGTNVPGQKVRGGLGRECHGSGYKGHIGIGMVCRVVVC